jgi:hypothetical protein
MSSVEGQGPGWSVALPGNLFCKKTSSSDITINALPFCLEEWGETVGSRPGFKLGDAFMHVVFLEVFDECRQVDLAGFGFCADNTAKGRGCESWGSATEKRVDIDVDEQGAVIGIDDAVEVESATAGDMVKDDFRDENIVNPATRLAGGYF